MRMAYGRDQHKPGELADRSKARFWLARAKITSKQGDSGPTVTADTLPGANSKGATEAKSDVSNRNGMGPDVEADPGGADRRAEMNPAELRQVFVQAILTEKGWSILDWANNSKVDFHTANDYLKGITNPYNSTRKKL